jgi:hypothetical protein
MSFGLSVLIFCSSIYSFSTRVSEVALGSDVFSTNRKFKIKLEIQWRHFGGNIASNLSGAFVVF